MKNISDSKNDVIKFLVEKNKRVQRKEIVFHVGSVSTDQALCKIIDLNDEMKELVTISNMNEENPYTKQKKIGYTLNKDIETFRKVFFYFYGPRNRWELLRTLYFNDMLPELINNFTSSMEQLKLDPLTPSEFRFILHRIRYPSVLQAVLCDNINIKKLIEFQMRERENLSHVLKVFFIKYVKQNVINTTPEEIIGSNLKRWHHLTSGGLTSIMCVFEFFMQQDRQTIYAQHDNAKLLGIDAEYQNTIKKETIDRFKKLQKDIDKGIMDSIFCFIPDV